MSILDDAIHFAVKAHRGQTRKDTGMPYVVHCIEVMKRVSDYGIDDEDILVAAVLHDVIEDCHESLHALIPIMFGDRVNELVKECTRPKEKSTSQGKYSFLMSFSEKSIGSVIIKIADRYCNTLDFTKTNPEYAPKYAIQAYPLYKTFINRHMSVYDMGMTRKTCMKILGEIAELNIIADEKYKGFSAFVCNMEKFVQDIVIGD